MKSVRHNLCHCCKHRHAGSHPPTCAAFPERIPLAIRTMKVDHRQPQAGDHGITFELRDDDAARAIYGEIVARLAKKSVFGNGQCPDPRVWGVKHLIQFKDNRERALFARQVAVDCRRFEELSARFQQLVLDAENTATVEPKSG